jgi:hypothetical protein
LMGIRYLNIPCRYRWKGRGLEWSEENCALLDSYAASSGNSLLTFEDNLSITPKDGIDRLSGSSWQDQALKLGPTGCPETSVKNYHYSLHKSPEDGSPHLLRGGSLKSRMDWSDPWQGLVAGCCEYGNESSDSVRYGGLFG